MHVETWRVRVSGVVQGVGFRPFVFRIAHEHGLAGFVRNLGDAGVDIVVRGPTSALDRFILDLNDRAPALARLDQVDIQPADDPGSDLFVIETSSEETGAGGQLPPDVATCEACVEEILGQSRFRGYWATSCTDCGPRFTVVRSLPYDRPRTSMADFPMCADCEAEYTNPHDRRYHAQTTACSDCGPALTFDGDPRNPVARAAGALANGRIVAIKGIGGTHLACDATDLASIEKLRERLGRSSRPFAIMGTESVLSEHVILTEEDLQDLRAPQRPILVVPKRSTETLPGVAPGLHTVGVMLPYAGVHHLLLDQLGGALVMTSANRPGEPMLIDNLQIVTELGGVVDHVLLHNRTIVARCDDTVCRRVAGRLVFLRRSRGFVPQGFDADLGEDCILALGPESDLTFAMYDGMRLTPSQHIGTVDNVDTLAFLREAILHLGAIARPGSPSVVACDAHPTFLTSRLADEIAAEMGGRVVRVQHHVAHLLSLVFDSQIEGGVVGIVLDGFGYGPDGTAWGGELLVADQRRVIRVGSLTPFRLPGGDQAAHQPLRLGASLLRAAGRRVGDVAEALGCRGMRNAAVDVLLKQIDGGTNAPWTTSAGRFLDAVSAWFGVCTQRGYEGEPAMRLEAVAARGLPHPVVPEIIRTGSARRLDVAGLFSELVELSGSISVEDVAATAQQALATGMAKMAMDTADEFGIQRVGLSGGVAYNDHIASTIVRACSSRGYEVCTHRSLPCGDGGVSAGQAVYAGGGWTFSDALRAALDGHPRAAAR